MKYDTIIIGGGPAGMMTAIQASREDKKTLLLEKNPSLGVKLLITGKGRCNICNELLDEREFVSRFGNKGKFLFSTFHQFSSSDTINFFEENGVQTKIERGGRVFPQSDRALDVLECLQRELAKRKVEIGTNAEVKKIASKNKKITKITLAGQKELEAKNFVISTGGKSYPQTGSSGEAFLWLEKLGHTIVPLSPALVPILCQENFIKDIEGLSLKNVEISIWEKGKKIISRFGEAIFTETGMSGPVILDLSNHVSPSKQQELKIDFKPALNEKEIDERVQSDFKRFNNKNFENSLPLLLPKKIIPLFVWLTKIDPQKKVNSITRDERKKLTQLLKNFTLTISGKGGFDKAIVTSGGVDLKEVNPSTMQSKIIDNLYLSGEVLDLDGPTGGFNLQVCWSTAYTAGQTISKL